MAVDQLHGVTITGGSTFNASITSVSINGVTRDAIPTSISSTTGAMTFQASDLYNGGELVIEGFYDNVKNWVTCMTASAETWTITWPIASGQSSAHTVAFTGFATAFQAGGPADGSPSLATYTLTVKIADDITFTPGS